jgi:molybdopterin-guanine dinucleotide biosynthesis protein B
MSQRPKVPVLGIAGWKKSGKTTLITRLIEEFTRRGFRVASVKHAHHAFAIDAGPTDSARHRQAGAVKVAIVSARRWALVHELGDAPEPTLAEVLGALGPCDLILVEGYKSEPIPKIEARRLAQPKRDALADHDPTVIAIAADHAADGQGRPVFALDDIAALAEFIASALNLGRTPQPGPRPAAAVDADPVEGRPPPETPARR